MLDSVTIVLDWFGLIIFAMTGALVASRLQMDIIGFVMLATITGIGGGTIRDIILGIQPIFWVEQPAYIVVCGVVAVVLFFTSHIPQSRLKLILWLDCIGLAVFAVTGAERALSAGAGTVVAVTMGIITATFGGIVRDILGGEEPVIRRPEIYVTAALLGASVFVLCVEAGTSRDAALISGFVGAFATRACALQWGLSLPRYRPRPPRKR